MIDLKNKHITVIGARRSGVAAARLIKNHGGIPFVSDSASEDSIKGIYSAFKE